MRSGKLRSRSSPGRRSRRRILWQNMGLISRASRMGREITTACPRSKGIAKPPFCAVLPVMPRTSLRPMNMGHTAVSVLPPRPLALCKTRPSCNNFSLAGRTPVRRRGRTFSPASSLPRKPLMLSDAWYQSLEAATLKRAVHHARCKPTPIRSWRTCIITTAGCKNTSPRCRRCHRPQHWITSVSGGTVPRRLSVNNFVRRCNDEPGRCAYPGCGRLSLGITPVKNAPTRRSMVQWMRLSGRVAPHPAISYSTKINTKVVYL
jgi:hypothetical protein